MTYHHVFHFVHGYSRENHGTFFILIISYSEESDPGFDATTSVSTSFSAGRQGRHPSYSGCSSLDIRFVKNIFRGEDGVKGGVLQRLHDALVSGNHASSSRTSDNPLQPVIPEPASILQQTADITDKTSLVTAFRDASVIVSLVGILNGTKEQFETIQWKGVRNVISAVREVNGKAKDGPVKKVVYISAIGADTESSIDYFRTKALAEKELLEAFGETGPSVTILRPSLVFGEGDGFFK
ncbi:hypothetical protein FRB90_007274, partial [Tulasnella sp. 427]